jgi:peptidoglycan/xylan/chitin deacetylase (PgdA/CDA1 family)
MRATSHCTNHPSREASVRCRNFGIWVCDRCTFEWRDLVYCGRACQLKAVAGKGLGSAAAFLIRRVDPGWSLGVLAAAAALLLAALGAHVAELIQVSGDQPAVRPVLVRQTHGLVGRLEADGDQLKLMVTGPPESSVMVLVGDLPPRTVELDADGYGELTGVPYAAGEPAVRLVPLSLPPLVLDAPPSPTPTVTATVTASASATPSSTATPSSSPTATATVTATVTPDEPSPGGSPTSTPRPMTARERRVVRDAPPVLHLVTDAGPRIALTFDGGHSANGTTEILDLLQELDLQVTLFLTGRFIERYPALVRRALLAGHEVGNHTFAHRNMTTYSENRRHQLLDHVTRDWLQGELRRTEEAFVRATGRTMAPLWRAPFGEENALIRGWALEAGYLHVRWSSLRGASLDSLDWINDEHSDLYQDSTNMVDRLLRFPRLEGGIVLMHLATDRPEPPWQDLPRFLEGLDGRGVEPVQVTTLLEESKIWRPWLEKARKRHRRAYRDSTR